MDTVRNNERFGVSFQVRHLQNIPAGDFEQKAPFLIKKHYRRKHFCGGITLWTI